MPDSSLEAPILLTPIEETLAAFHAEGSVAFSRSLTFNSRTACRPDERGARRLVYSDGRVDNVSEESMPSKATNDPGRMPAYSIAEAAHYLRMPEGTLRSWVVGRIYPVAGQSKRSRPLIHLDDPKLQYLSFINLVEAHVLAAIRRRHGVKLPKVRSALDYLRRQFRVEHLLIDQDFQTDGLDLFVERYGELINASRAGQREMKEIIGVYLKRIEWDAKRLRIKLYPFTRDTEADAAPASDPRVVVVNPAVSFGRPVIAGTGIPVSFIYERYRAGDSVAELAEDFRLESSAIEEAIRCEAA